MNEGSYINERMVDEGPYTNVRMVDEVNAKERTVAEANARP